MFLDGKFGTTNPFLDAILAQSLEIHQPVPVEASIPSFGTGVDMSGLSDAQSGLADGVGVLGGAIGDIAGHYLKPKDKTASPNAPGEVTAVGNPYAGGEWGAGGDLAPTMGNASYGPTLSAATQATTPKSSTKAVSASDPLAHTTNVKVVNKNRKSWPGEGDHSPETRSALAGLLTGILNSLIPKTGLDAYPDYSGYGNQRQDSLANFGGNYLADKYLS